MKKQVKKKVVNKVNEQKEQKTTEKLYEKNKENILEAKKIIEEQKKKIKSERASIKKKRFKQFKKTKFGKALGKVCFLFSDEKDTYSFSEVMSVTIVSLLLGAFACFCVFVILSGGRNYFKMSKKFDKFYDVYDVITSNYNGNVDEDKLIEAAINGMVKSVGDAYTNYNDVEQTDEFNQLVNGTYEGIGCTISQTEEAVVVIDVYPNSPADKAGLKPNDIMVSVDDKNALELGTEKIANYIRYEATGEIEIVVKRDDEEKTFTLSRGKVETPTVSSKIFEKNDKKIGYLNISIFSAVTAKQFKNKLEALEKEEIDALVIDVRDNNGGYLASVTDIASLLLPRGKAIYQIQSGNKKKITKDKTVEKREYPIAVITNNGSASASEILAAVVKESYDNGYVVGTKTFGKGTVQQVKKLPDGSMIKYTVENWLTPNGNWINEKGIDPTDKIELDQEYFDNPSTETDNQLQKALELVSE